VVAAFSPIAKVNREVGVDDLLRLVADGARKLLDVSRSAVYLRNADTGLFEGRCAQGPPWTETAIPRTICGQEFDGLTREILATGRAVPVTDARHDSRPVRAAVLAWGIRSLMGVPITDDGQIIGLIFVDDGQRARAYDQGEIELLEMFAALTSGVVARTLEIDRLRTEAKALNGQNRVLQATVAFGDRLAALVAEGGGLPEVAAVVAQFTGKSCALYDGRGPLRAAADAAATPDDRAPAFAATLAAMPDVDEAVARATPGRPTILAPGSEGLREHRLLLLRAPSESPEAGVILLEEGASRLRVLDANIVRRAAAMVDLIVRAETYKARCLRALVADLLAGRAGAAAAASAAQYGLDLGAPHVVCLLPERPGLAPEAVADAFGRATGGPRRLAVEVGSRIAVLLELDASGPVPAAMGRLKEVAAEALALLGDEPGAALRAGLSSPCREPGDYRHAVAEAEYALEQGGEPVVAADDLGAGHLLTIGTDAARGARFARGVMAPLLDDPTPGAAVLISTLDTFFACSRSIRQTAQELNVHENTIRYRLGSVTRKTGLDIVGSAKDELTVQLALQLR